MPNEDLASASFCANLRLALSYDASISEASRQLGISRQQLTRYLSGASFPSRSNMRVICDHVGCDEYEMLLPHDQFRNLVRVRPNRGRTAIVAPPLVDELLEQARRQNSALSRYAGFYYKYYPSFSRPGQVLQALVCVTSWNGYTVYKCIERLSVKPRSTQHEVYKYTGIMTLLGERIHMLDLEAISRRELSQTILFPGYRHHVGRLTGLTMGVSGGDGHQPTAARVVMEYIGRRIDRRKALQGCRLHALKSPELASGVRNYLIGGGRGDGVRPLRAEFG